MSLSSFIFSLWGCIVPGPEVGRIDHVRDHIDRQIERNILKDSDRDTSLYATSLLNVQLVCTASIEPNTNFGLYEQYLIWAIEKWLHRRWWTLCLCFLAKFPKILSSISYIWDGNEMVSEWSSSQNIFLFGSKTINLAPFYMQVVQK